MVTAGHFFCLFLSSQNMLKKINIISNTLDPCACTHTHTADTGAECFQLTERWSWVTWTHPCSAELWTAVYWRPDNQPPVDQGNGNYSKISCKRQGIICHKLTPRNHLQTWMYLLCDTMTPYTGFSDSLRWLQLFCRSCMFMPAPVWLLCQQPYSFEETLHHNVFFSGGRECPLWKEAGGAVNIGQAGCKGD